MVSEMQLEQTFSHRVPAGPPEHLPACPDTMGENNTLAVLKGCRVKTQ